MATVTLPVDKFDANMTFVRPAETPSRIPLDRLAPLPGFNTRVKDAEYRERVANLAASIEQHGFYEHKPLAVVMLPDDETVYFYDGEHRFDAAKLASLNGVEFDAGLPVSFAPEGVTVTGLTVALVRDNDGANLSPIEMAAVVRRLSSYGMEKDEIAAQIGRTVRHVENLMVLAGANAATKRAVAEGQIAAAEAVKLVRKHGVKDGGEKIAQAVRAAEERGKAKATPKTMAAAAAPAGPKMKQIKLSVSLATGDTMGAVLKSMAGLIREQVKTDPEDKLLEDGSVNVILHVIDHEAAAAAEAKAAERAKADQERRDRMAARDAERAEAAKKREEEKAAAAAAKAEPKAKAEPEAKAAPKRKAAPRGKAAAPAEKPAEAPAAALAPETTAETPPAPVDGAEDGNNGL